MTDRRSVRPRFLLQAGCVAAACIGCVLPAMRAPQPPRDGDDGVVGPPGGLPVEHAVFLSELERQVLIETNRARRDPAGFAATLASWRRHFRGRYLERPGEIPLRTSEGVGAFDEAIDALLRATAAPPLRVSRGMSAAARDHVEDLSRSGGAGHEGSDGSDFVARLSRYGQIRRSAGENLMFGRGDGLRVVVSLIVDDGVPDRGHRRNLLNPSYRVAGVACGPHPLFDQMCAISYADGYVDSR